jgi:hypothetical protein
MPTLNQLVCNLIQIQRCHRKLVVAQHRLRELPARHLIKQLPELRGPARCSDQLNPRARAVAGDALERMAGWAQWVLDATGMSLVHDLNHDST